MIITDIINKYDKFTIETTTTYPSGTYFLVSRNGVSGVVSVEHLCVGDVILQENVEGRNNDS